MIVGKALKQRLSMDPRVRNPATSILSLTTSSSSTTTFLVPSSHQYSGVQNIGKLGLHFHLGRPTTTKRVFKEHRSIMLTNGNFPRPTKQNHLIHRNKDSDNYNNQTAWANIIIGNDCLLTLSFVHGNDALGLLTLVTYSSWKNCLTGFNTSNHLITMFPTRPTVVSTHYYHRFLMVNIHAYNRRQGKGCRRITLHPISCHKILGKHKYINYHCY